jgi:undecaprenyl diphosphate synthase
MIFLRRNFVMQSSFDQKTHVAIIMDGNRRWARLRGVPAVMGHAAGVEALRTVIDVAPTQGITTLTVYAFSSGNWHRSSEETTALMELLYTYLDSQTEDLVQHGIRFSAIGRRNRLAPSLVREIERSESVTAWGDVLHLRVAIDYSARDTILGAAQKATAGYTQEQFGALLADGDGSSNVDLLIRTGNEQRLSDFLLWECAYAELYFTPCLWPDFGPTDLAKAMKSFRQRERRFGGGAGQAA